MRYALLSLALTLYPLSSLADPGLVGLWGFGSCDTFEEIEYQGHAVAVYHDDDGPRVLFQQLMELDNSDWTLVRTDERDPYPSLAHASGNIIRFAWPKVEATEASEIQALHRALLTGQMDPDEAPDLFDIDIGTRCAGLPLPEALFFGEILAVLSSFDNAIHQCAASPVACPRTLFDAVDVSSDGELSVAEMARVFRNAVAIASALEENSATVSAVGASASAFVLAPLAASGMLHSFDYDASGTLSLAEVMRDRTPSMMPDARDMQLGAWLDGLSDAAKAAAAAAGGLLR